METYNNCLSKSYLVESIRIESGSVVLVSAIMNTGTIIGRASIINVGVIVEHGYIISDVLHTNLGAILMAENHAPKFSKVESGNVILVHFWKKA